MADSGAPVTWESLETYIAGYKGSIKVKRLEHIAETFEALRLPALLLALRILEEETLDTTSYQRVAQAIQMVDTTYVINDAWIQETTRKADGTTEKLEHQLKAYKNNLIKESIRLGQQELAEHYAHMGQLENALKALFRNRDYCTAPQHTFQVHAGIISLSIMLGQWQQVLTYVNKIESVMAQQKDAENAKETKEEGSTRPGLLALATALASLQQDQYRKAVDNFRQVPAGTDTKSTVTLNDIANYTCLLALATYDRQELHGLIESSAFKPFLELELAPREALTAFYKSRYADCFRLLDSIKGNMRGDLFFAPHVDAIYSLIMERAMLQFTQAFNLVSLTRMAQTFDLSVEQVEAALASLIASKKLPNMRLNMTTCQLVDEGNILRNEVFDKAAQMSAHFKEEADRALFNLAVTKAGLTVDPPKPVSKARQPQFEADAREQRMPDLVDGDMMMDYE